MRANLIAVFYLLICNLSHLMGALPHMDQALDTVQKEQPNNQNFANPDDIIALESWLNKVQDNLYHTDRTFSAAVLDAIDMTFTAFFSKQEYEQLLYKLAALINSTSITPKGIITDLLTHVAIPITEITTVHAMLTVILSISNHSSSVELTEAYLNNIYEDIAATLKTKCSTLPTATIDEQPSPLGTVFLWALLLSVVGIIGYLLYQHIQKNNVIDSQTRALYDMQDQMQNLQESSQARIRGFQHTIQQLRFQATQEARHRQRNTGRIIRILGSNLLGPMILDSRGNTIGSMDLYTSYNIDLSSRRVIFEPRFREDLQRLRNH